MTQPATRWGILGAGRISGDFTTALSLLPDTEHKVVAVAARTLKGAQEFAGRHKIPTSYGCYTDLANDANVDVVYVGTIHPTHYDLCKMLLGLGKSVLCEKPMAMNSKQLHELTSLARNKKLLLVEGFWSCHFPAWKQLEAEIEKGTIGEVKMITAEFGLNLFENNERMTNRSMGGGVTMDLGCYCIMAINKIFKEVPEKVVATGILYETGVDLAASITLHYSNMRMATINVSALVQLANNWTVCGSSGILQLPNFWSANKLETPNGTQTFELPSHKYSFTYPRGEGFTYEAQAIRQSLLTGEAENSRMPLVESEQIMRLMDEVRRQLGVVYDEDA